MSGAQKPAANRSTLLQFKARVVGAKKGHGLLKSKRDALKTRFQMMLQEIITCKKDVSEVIKDAAFSMAKAEWACETEISTAILSRVKKPSVTTKFGADNVAGVQLPVFKIQHTPGNDAALDSLGIGCGGQVIQTARDQHKTALELLIKMASLQCSFKTLDEAIKMTSRRVNALECVVIPRLASIQEWIKGEMDEMEREEFFRVKKVVEKKKIRMAAELDMRIQENAAAMKKASTRSSNISQQRNPSQGPGPVESVLGQSRDQDLLF